jgi:hypothetical protein
MTKFNLLLFRAHTNTRANTQQQHNAMANYKIDDLKINL